MGITILPPRRFCFLILFSFCLLTVQLHFTPIVNFKQSTHAQKKNDTHTCTHKELSWDVINFSFLWSSALLSGLALIFLLLSFSVQFLFREVLLPHCRFKGYNAIKYLIIPEIPDTNSKGRFQALKRGMRLLISTTL